MQTTHHQAAPAAKPTDEDIFLSPKQLAARWDLKLKTLANMRADRRGPKYKNLGNRVRYRLDWIKAFEEKNPAYRGRGE